MKADVRGHLLALENESIHVLREVAAQFERPVLLFSGGKDSIEVHERVGGHAASRPSVRGRAVIASYAQLTQIEIPVPHEPWSRLVLHAGGSARQARAEAAVP
jgi:3'-phosphoadenosine 5'-phosphosulfate sulfotransferase (PAPS reductase)/FAD synthetase